jgi:hypothetical protein
VIRRGAKLARAVSEDARSSAEDREGTEGNEGDYEEQGDNLEEVAPAPGCDHANQSAGVHR